MYVSGQMTIQKYENVLETKKTSLKIFDIYLSACGFFYGITISRVREGNNNLLANCLIISRKKSETNTIKVGH